MFSPKRLFLAAFSVEASAATAAILSYLTLVPEARAQSAVETRLPAPARDPSREPESVENSTETRWYGYQPALTDAAALGLMYGALATWRLCLSLGDNPPPCNNDESNQLADASVATYLLAAPVIHGLHGHWDKAGLSLGMRLAPVLFALSASAAQGNRGSSNLAGGTLVVGVFAAMIIDDAWLSRETVPKSSAWYAAPAVDPKRRSVSLAVGAVF
ncbi:MAG TPA: hypothetical protein VNW92_15945 [Polyangiaceae bacterium]|jgi:hypothetical protein|nr:hypothetical protein [Polyangiaceae bacterium]